MCLLILVLFIIDRLFINGKYMSCFKLYTSHRDAHITAIDYHPESNLCDFQVALRPSDYHKVKSHIETIATTAFTNATLCYVSIRPISSREVALKQLQGFPPLPEDPRVEREHGGRLLESVLDSVLINTHFFVLTFHFKFIGEPNEGAAACREIQLLAEEKGARIVPPLPPFLPLPLFPPMHHAPMHAVMALPEHLPMAVQEHPLIFPRAGLPLFPARARQAERPVLTSLYCGVVKAPMFVKSSAGAEMLEVDSFAGAPRSAAGVEKPSYADLRKAARIEEKARLMKSMELAKFGSLYASYPHPLLSFDMMDAEAIDSKNAAQIEKSILRRVFSYSDIDNSLIVRITLFTNLINRDPDTERFERYFPFSSNSFPRERAHALATVMTPDQRATTLARMLSMHYSNSLFDVAVRDEVPSHVHAGSPYEYGPIRRGDPRGDMVRIDGENIPIDQETYIALKQTCLQVIQKRRELDMHAEVILVNQETAWKRRRHALFPLYLLMRKPEKV